MIHSVTVPYWLQNCGSLADRELQSSCTAQHSTSLWWAIKHCQQPVSDYRIASQKSLPRPTIYRQKSAPPGRAGRIFTGKLSAGGDFSWEVFFNWETFYGAGDILILIKERHIKSVIISLRADFSWGRHFNVKPALQWEFLTGLSQRSIAPFAATYGDLIEMGQYNRCIVS